jgi:hypothetical protein
MEYSNVLELFLRIEYYILLNQFHYIQKKIMNKFIEVFLGKIIVKTS